MMCREKFPTFLMVRYKGSDVGKANFADMGSQCRRIMTAKRVDRLPPLGLSYPEQGCAGSIARHDFDLSLPQFLHLFL